MTKKNEIQEASPNTSPAKRYRRLTKAEEEEYTREMNAIWSKVSKAIQDEQIVLPEWRRNP